MTRTPSGIKINKVRLLIGLTLSIVEKLEPMSRRPLAQPLQVQLRFLRSNSLKYCLSEWNASSCNPYLIECRTIHKCSSNKDIRISCLGVTMSCFDICISQGNEFLFPCWSYLFCSYVAQICCVVPTPAERT